MTFFTGYLALGIGSNRFVETGDAGYQRAAVTVVPVGNGGFSVVGTVTNGSQTMGTQLAIYDAATGGSQIFWWKLSSPVLFASAFAALNSYAHPALTIPSLEGQIGTSATAMSFALGQVIGFAADGTPIAAGSGLTVSNGTLSAVSATGSTPSAYSGLTSVTVSASGNSQTLTFQGTQTVYDITQTAPCSLNVNTSGALEGDSILLVLRGPYSWVGPSNTYYANGSAPVPQCSATLVDIIQYTLLANGSLLGTPVALGAGVSTLAVSAFSGTTYSTNSVIVSGTYTGTAPTNLDYSVDGAAFATITAGSASITNGTFSFTLSSTPGVGSHSIVVRATGTNEVSPTQAFTVSAPIAPSAPTLSATAGTAQNTLNLSAQPNGAAVTQFTIYRGTTAGGESGTAIGTATATNNSATYTDGSLTNGTTYYYKATATNSVGTSGMSAEASATPAVSAVPAHYFASDSTHGAYSGKAEGITDGYIDIAVEVGLPSFTATNYLFSRWNSAGATSSNSEYLFTTGSSGLYFGALASGGSTVQQAGSSAALSSVATVNTPIWARVQANLSGGTINGLAAGSVVFSTSTDGVTFSPLGTTITGVGSAGINQLSAGGTPAACGSGTAGATATLSFYKAVVKNSAGAILYNPDFTAQATGTTSFVDTAAAPNTWTLSAGGQK